AVPENSWAEHLVAAPHSRVMGRDIYGLLSGAVATTLQRGAATEDFVHYENQEGCSGFFCRGLLLDPDVGRWSLLVWRATPADFSAVRNGTGTPEISAEDLMMVGSNLVFEPTRPTAAFHFAYEGALGDFVSKQAEPDPFDPSRHRYDGFGLPESWV